MTKAAAAKAGRLDATAKVILESAERARPSTTRPRVDEESERRLAALERDTAACYTSMEMLSHQFRKAAAIISEDDGVVELEADDADSVVRHIDALHQKVTL